MSDDLMALQQEWYLKLEQEGFKDIENTDTPHRPLKKWHKVKFQDVTEDHVQAKLSYYSKAKDLLRSHSFESQAHKEIWEMHSDGLSKRKIERLLKDSSTPFKREYIGKVIALLAHEIK